jgi:hypothetical protein
MKKLIILSAVSLLAITLAACGGDSGGKTVVVTPGSPPDPNSKFGSKFAADFKADPNSDPASVASGDVVAVDPSKDPSSVN